MWEQGPYYGYRGNELGARGLGTSAPEYFEQGVHGRADGYGKGTSAPEYFEQGAHGRADRHGQGTSAPEYREQGAHGRADGYGQGTSAPEYFEQGARGQADGYGQDDTGGYGKKGIGKGGVHGTYDPYACGRAKNGIGKGGVHGTYDPYAVGRAKNGIGKGGVHGTYDPYAYGCAKNGIGKGGVRGTYDPYACGRAKNGIGKGGVHGTYDPYAYGMNNTKGAEKKIGQTSVYGSTAFKHSDGHIYDFYSEDMPCRLCHWAETWMHGVCDYWAVRTWKGCAKKAKAYEVCDRCYRVQKAQSDVSKATRDNILLHGLVEEKKQKEDEEDGVQQPVAFPSHGVSSTWTPAPAPRGMYEAYAMNNMCAAGGRP